MTQRPDHCPDCDRAPDLTPTVHRRDFLKAAGVAAATAAGGVPLFAVPKAAAAPTPNSAAETAVKGLYETLTPEQRAKMCFAWDYKDPKRGLLRTHVSNNWHIVEQTILGDFYTKKQQHLIHDIYKGLLNPSGWRGSTSRPRTTTTASRGARTRTSPSSASRVRAARSNSC